MKNKKIKGSIIIWAVVLLPVFLGFSLISLDTWHVYLVYNQMSVASDAAALAGATSLRSLDPSNTDSASSLALSIASSNKFTNGAGNTTVTVKIPPGDPFNKSPSYATNADFVRVQISQLVPLYFGALFKIPNMTVQANAVAGPVTYYPLIVVLSPSVSGSLQLTGGSSIIVSNGVIGVNSNSSSAVSVSNNSKITASKLNIVGGYSSGGTINAQINASTSPTSDPFSSLSLPAPPFNCNYTNYSISKKDTFVLDPGVYCGGITISGSGTIQFNPGTYILNGGGLKVTGSSTITGNGVTFYNTGTASGSTKYGSISIAGSGSIALSAPTSGTYTGMLFIQDSKNTNDVSISGSNTQNFMGNIYSPASGLTITGSGKMARPIGICVANTITIKGGGEITFTPSYTTGSYSGKVVLFE